MSRELLDRFCWGDAKVFDCEKLSDTERYKGITDWALKARGINPGAFDALTEWVLNDTEWCDEKLAENEELLVKGVLKQFKEQNAHLRKILTELDASGVVNKAVFRALDRFDSELSGSSFDENMRKAVSMMFSDFTVMLDKSLRGLIAGNKTGPSGTDSVDLYGYINCLKDCDAGVQWALFMPDVVKRQQNGFKVESFEYIKMPALRFIGRESLEGDGLDNIENLKKLFQTFDNLDEYKTDFSYDIMFMHHYGLGVDVGKWHGFWGRFMRADTPVPEGFLYFDFIPNSDRKAGPPYISQFAYAIFSGDIDAMHRNEGYDSDAMYDVTRNIMLGQGVNIPYPDKYWTAEVFPDGCEKPSTAYMFSAEL